MSECHRCRRFEETMAWVRQRLNTLIDLDTLDQDRIRATLLALARALDPEENPRLRPRRGA